MLATLTLAAASTADDTTALDAIKDASAATLGVVAAIWLIHLILWIFIAKKAGYSGWCGFLGVLIPPLGLILFIVFGLAKWPALSQRDAAVDAVEKAAPSA